MHTYTRDEICELLGISPRTLFRREKDGLVQQVGSGAHGVSLWRIESLDGLTVAQNMAVAIYELEKCCDFQAISISYSQWGGPIMREYSGNGAYNVCCQRNSVAVAHVYCTHDLLDEINKIIKEHGK